MIHMITSMSVEHSTNQQPVSTEISLLAIQTHKILLYQFNHVEILHIKCLPMQYVQTFWWCIKDDFNSLVLKMYNFNANTLELCFFNTDPFI